MADFVADTRVMITMPGGGGRRFSPYGPLTHGIKLAVAGRAGATAGRTAAAKSAILS